MAPKSEANNVVNYEKLRNELEAILSELESGETGIDEAINKYERGQVIIKQLESFLRSAENKISKISSQKINNEKA